MEYNLTARLPVVLFVPSDWQAGINEEIIMKVTKIDDREYLVQRNFSHRGMVVKQMRSGLLSTTEYGMPCEPPKDISKAVLAFIAKECKHTNLSTSTNGFICNECDEHLGARIE